MTSRVRIICSCVINVIACCAIFFSATARCVKLYKRDIVQFVCQIYGNLCEVVIAQQRVERKMRSFFGVTAFCTNFKLS